MPEPLDDFGLAYHELLDASDEVIDEIAAQSLRGPRTGAKGRRQIVVPDVARIRAARAIQLQRRGGDRLKVGFVGGPPL